MLDKYKLPATFFIPGLTAESYPDLCREIAARGHEMGVHGYCHELSYESCDHELSIMEQSMEILKRFSGKYPVGFRSPSGELSKNTVKILVDKGFVYDSSLSADDFTPYYLRSGDEYEILMRKPVKFGKDTKLVEIPWSWSLDDFPHFEFVQMESFRCQGLSPPSRVKESWLGDFDYCYHNIKNGFFMIIMHPQCIGRGARMLMLEEIIQYVNSKPGVWWTTLAEIARCFY